MSMVSWWFSHLETKTFLSSIAGSFLFKVLYPISKANEAGNLWGWPGLNITYTLFTNANSYPIKSWIKQGIYFVSANFFALWFVWPLTLFGRHHFLIFNLFSFKFLCPLSIFVFWCQSKTKRQIVPSRILKFFSSDYKTKTSTNKMFTNCLALWARKKLVLLGLIKTTTNQLMKSKLSHL